MTSRLSETRLLFTVSVLTMALLTVAQSRGEDGSSRRAAYEARLRTDNFRAQQLGIALPTRLPGGGQLRFRDFAGGIHVSGAVAANAGPQGRALLVRLRHRGQAAWVQGQSRIAVACRLAFGANIVCQLIRPGWLVGA